MEILLDFKNLESYVWSHLTMDLSILYLDSPDEAVLYLSLVILNQQYNIVNRHWKIGSEFNVNW